MLDTLDLPPQKLPVTIVTGFLGSGKTTLLNHIIQNFEGYKIAVLVNEFGDINIDSQLLVKIGNDEDESTIDQIFCGDIIVLNKTDLVSEERVNKTEEFLRSVKEGAQILRSSHSKVPLSLLLDTNLSNPDFFDKAMTDVDVDSQHLKNNGFMSISFQSDRPIVLKKFQQFLDYQLPENVFRAKGILWFDESPLRHIFQLSGKRFSIDDSEWTTPQKIRWY